MPRKILNKAQNIFIMLLLLWFESILNRVEKEYNKNSSYIHNIWLESQITPELMQHTANVWFYFGWNGRKTGTWTR